MVRLFDKLKAYHEREVMVDAEKCDKVEVCLSSRCSLTQGVKAMRLRLFQLIMRVCSSMRVCPAELELPELLTMENGKKVVLVDVWRSRRRPEILELFRSHVYGRAPVGRPKNLTFEVEDITRGLMDGKATRKQVKISFQGPGGKGTLRLLVFVPNNIPRPLPCFLLICQRKPKNIDPRRKIKTPFWPAERIVARGYATATFHVSDVDPNRHDGFKNGVHRIFDTPGEPRLADAWGTIAAWAWGASRAMDYFEMDSNIDQTRVSVVGHSCCGKTALWCGAEDERFALIISNNSGCTGAALARRKRGETVKAINRFPHWFCENYKRYNNKEHKLPVDQHMLIALMAPRLVYVASATKDGWADPEGEFLSCVHAEPVYRLFGLEGLKTTSMPKPDCPIHNGHIGYHIRTGKHDLTEYGWNCFMDFADKHFNTSNDMKNITLPNSVQWF